MRSSLILAVGMAAVLAGCAGNRNSGTAGAERVNIAVTEKGFEPAVVTIPADKPVTLVVTRKTDKTCATDFVMAERGINQPLPLDRPVEIPLAPGKPGDLHYACGMDMYKGTVRVQ